MLKPWVLNCIERRKVSGQYFIYQLNHLFGSRIRIHPKPSSAEESVFYTKIVCLSLAVTPRSTLFTLVSMIILEMP